MTTPTATMLTTGVSSLRGMREDLANFVSRITPEDTPFFSWCGSGTAYNDLAHDWQTVTLRAGAKNAQAEGDTFTPTAVKRTVRLTNVCQISSEIASVSGTSEAVRKAGRDSEIDYQVMLKAIEVRFDVEEALLCARVKKATDPREMAGIKTWVGVGNYSGGAGATEPTADGAVAPIAGTARPLDIDDLNKTMRDAWIKGARVDTMMMHPTQKLLFDELPTSANLAEVQENVSSTGAPFTTTVSLWRSAFGTIKLVMNRHMDESDILGLDGRSQVRPKKAPLVGRNFVRKPPQLNFDGKAEAVIFEGTLEVPNPDSVCLWSGLNTDLNT